MNIKDRLQEIINSITNGNKKKFAEKAGINQSTMQNYMKGRIPKADALEKICKTYNINLNWLVAEVGTIYIQEERKTEEKKRDEYITLIENWVEESTKNDPRNKIWFELQFEKKFPEFKFWLKKKESPEGRQCYSDKKVA